MSDIDAITRERDDLLEQLEDIAHDSRDSTSIGRKYWLRWRDVRAELRTMTLEMGLVTEQRDRARDLAARLEAEIALQDEVIDVAEFAPHPYDEPPC